MSTNSRREMLLTDYCQVIRHVGQSHTLFADADGESWMRMSPEHLLCWHRFDHMSSQLEHSVHYLGTKPAHQFGGAESAPHAAESPDSLQALWDRLRKNQNMSSAEAVVKKLFELMLK